jgi:hypothetical protein
MIIVSALKKYLIILFLLFFVGLGFSMKIVSALKIYNKSFHIFFVGLGFSMIIVSALIAITMRSSLHIVFTNSIGPEKHLINMFLLCCRLRIFNDNSIGPDSYLLCGHHCILYLLLLCLNGGNSSLEGL